MRQLFTLCLFLLIFTNLSAQNGLDFWKNTPAQAVVLPENVVEEFKPLQYSAFQLNYEGLKNALLTAPMEYAQVQKSLVIMLPQADGTVEPFTVRESPVLMPGIQAAHPDIRTFTGESVVNPGKKMRASLTLWGFKAAIRFEDNHMEYVEPIAKGQQQWYRVYDIKDFPNELRPKGKLVLDPTHISKEDLQEEPRFAPQFEMEERGLSAPVKMKIYRFALSCQAEFSIDHGGTKPLVLSAITEYVNVMNVVYEADLDIRLKLIDEEEKLIFLDPATDPFSGITVFNWMGQNQGAIYGQLQDNNKYDLAHVFARFNAGDAIGVAGGLCCTNSKANGCSAGFPPYGAGFLSIPGQEIGHQWAGGHTWNRCDANDQFTYESACEPGSGSTIMSYAGSCGADNVQNNADLYYQACSITEIRNFVENGVGATCGLEEMTTNNTPVAMHNYSDNFFIPISTPFYLEGSAVDPDGDPNLTYIWDEIDLGPSRPMGDPQANSPLFRSYPPSASGHVRYFPKIISLIANTTDKREVLPTYSRDLTFRLVVRDNRAGGGGLGWKDLAFKSTDLAGPFVVTSPNASADKWTIGDYATVTWDVANTDKAPVNCSKVNILLSTNGGQTYPITLAAGVPNNGVACVLVPNNPSSSARVRVQAADNIFFDVSNAHFKIAAPTAPDFAICTEELTRVICTPKTYTATITTAAYAGFAGNITLSANVPTNATATFSPITVAAGGTSIMTVTLPGTVAEGYYTIGINAVSNGNAKIREVKLRVINNDFSGLALQTPTDGETGVVQNPTLNWAAVPDADKFEVQVASNPSFASGTVVASNANLVNNTYNVSTLLQKGTAYFWRVRPINECGIGAWTSAFSFGTLQQSCATSAAQDLPKTITSNGTPTVESKLTINNGGTISDLNIKQLKGSHNSFWDVEARLIGPDGTSVLLFKEKCGPSVSNFNMTIDQQAPGATFPCPPSTATNVKPTESLDVFNGKSSVGQWTLQIKDTKTGGSGDFSAFQLEICSATSLNPPVIVNNNLLEILPGSNALIPNNLLKADDPNNTADQLTFTLVTVPKNGFLDRTGYGALSVGAQFQQSDLDNGAIRYFDYGHNAGEDQFKFIVTDGEGGMVSGTYVIRPFPVNTLEAAVKINFDLAPNPATETVRLTFGEALPADTRIGITNTAGQLVQQQVIATGENSANLDISALPAGIYFVSVQTGNKTGVKKMVVR